MTKNTFNEIRREYGLQNLNEDNIHSDPIVQFQQWFDEIVKTQTIDPTAMVLATVDHQGIPNSRVLLLKDIIEGCFIFYSNYQSAKGHEIENNPNVALNFYWATFCRQVRVRGKAAKVTSELSDHYFSTRPRSSQISAIVSQQSEVIANRDVLEQEAAQLTKDYQDKIIERPEHWGGYQVKPFEIEFWQGRDNRMHDRLRYTHENNQWKMVRLAP